MNPPTGVSEATSDRTDPFHLMCFYLWNWLGLLEEDTSAFKSHGSLRFMEIANNKMNVLWLRIATSTVRCPTLKKPSPVHGFLKPCVMLNIKSIWLQHQPLPQQHGCKMLLSNVSAVSPTPSLGWISANVGSPLGMRKGYYKQDYSSK